ncbi:MAG: hypothetical protein R6U88_01265, partial [Candidatus Bipolaricaulota bacterium]
ANKISSPEDARSIQQALPSEIRFLGTVGAWDELRLAGVEGLGAMSSELEREVAELFSRLQAEAGTVCAEEGKEEQEG